MNTDNFLELLGKSGLVTEDQIYDALALLDGAATKQQLEDAEFVGKAMVDQGLITPWHLRQLLKRRYKGFFIRQYKILGLLGAGGMSTVYLAEHTLMHRRVAIKVLPKDRLKKSAYLDHFVREAQVIATLDHPNIVRAYDIDREDDIHYIVMEFFDGVNLQKKVETEGPLPVPDIVLYVRQAAEALAYAHKIGIVHRDVKPGNLLVNAKNRVKLLDLGLAMIDQRLYSGNLSSSIHEASVLGTADYLAPEQAINSQNIDSRADIYALGGVLYFCLTGHPPFPTGSVSERLLAHQQKEPTSILKDRPNTAKDLVAICQKMMAKDPNKRQQTADEVVRDLDRWLIDHGHIKEKEKLSSPVKPVEKPKPTETLPEPKVEQQPETPMTPEPEKSESKPEPEPQPPTPELPTSTEKPAPLPPLSIPSRSNLTLPPLPPTVGKSGTTSLPKLTLPPLPKKGEKPNLPPIPLPPALPTDRPKTLPPVLPPLPPKKQATTTEKERDEYLTPVDEEKPFGKYEEETAVTSGAEAIVFDENREIVVDLNEPDSELTVSSFGMKTDIDLTVHEEPKIDDSFLTPDPSMDLGGKTDLDIESTAIFEVLEPEPQPQPEHSPEPQPEPQPTPEPKKEETIDRPTPVAPVEKPEEPPKSEPVQEKAPAPQKSEPKTEPKPADKPKPEPSKPTPGPEKKAVQQKQVQQKQAQQKPIAPTAAKPKEKPQPQKPQPQKPQPEKPKSQIQVDQPQPLPTATDSPSGIMRVPGHSKGGIQRVLPGATGSETTAGQLGSPDSGTYTLVPQEQIVIKPPEQGRVLKADPEPAPQAQPLIEVKPQDSPGLDIFSLATDSPETDIFPIAGEEPKPRMAPSRTGPQTPGKAPAKKKQLTDDDYDKMLTNFVSSQMPVKKGDENDEAVLHAVEELKREEEARKKAEEEKRKAEEKAFLEKAKKAKLERERLEKKSLVQKIGTITGITLKPALKKELEMEEVRGPVAAPRPEKPPTWLETVPFWFWIVFGSFIVLTVIFAILLATAGGK